MMTFTMSSRENFKRRFNLLFATIFTILPLASFTSAHFLRKSNKSISKSAPPCNCESDNPNWKSPDPDRPPVCAFFDLGAAGGNSYQTFLSDDNLYLPPTKMMEAGKFNRTDGKFGSKAECYAYLVEANPKFNGQLSALSASGAGYITKEKRLDDKEGSRIYALGQNAVYMCDKDDEVFYIDQETTHDHWGSALDSNHPSVKSTANSDTSKVHVRLQNLARLIKENVKPGDLVYIKMDIEGAEWDILPCLAKNQELAKLITVFYVENHCPGGPGGGGWCVSTGQVGTTMSEWQNAISTFQNAGVQMPFYFTQSM